MEYDLAHGYNSDLPAPAGVVENSINGTIRLLSDFEVRYNELVEFIYSSFWYHMAAGSWFTHGMHLAILRTWVITYSKVLMIIWTDWISSQPPIDDRFILCCLLQNGSHWSIQEQES